MNEREGDEMERRDGEEGGRGEREKGRDEDAPRMPQEIISPPGCAASGNT